MSETERKSGQRPFGSPARLSGDDVSDEHALMKCAIEEVIKRLEGVEAPVPLRPQLLALLNEALPPLERRYDHGRRKYDP